MNEWSGLLLNHPQDSKSKNHGLHTHTHTHKISTVDTRKKLPEKLLFAARMRYIGVQASLHPTKPHIYISAVLPPGKLRLNSWCSPLCPQAHFEIKPFFEDRPTNKLNYFCYATTNGEKAQSSR